MRYDAEVSAAVTQARRNYAVAPEPALVHAVIERETAHAPYSSGGTLEPNGRRSYGPMQVMDSTASLHGITDPKTLNVPSIGIRIGTFELARLMSLFPTDTAHAIAAYNGGPGVRRTVAGKYINQPYVDRVLGLWNRFRASPAASPAMAALAALVLVVVLSHRRSGRLRAA